MFEIVRKEEWKNSGNVVIEISPKKKLPKVVFFSIFSYHLI